MLLRNYSCHWNLWPSSAVSFSACRPSELVLSQTVLPRLAAVPDGSGVWCGRGLDHQKRTLWSSQSENGTIFSPLDGLLLRHSNKYHSWAGTQKKGDLLDPVVQSVVSLTSSLRAISLTVLEDSIHNILIFFAEKMCCKSYSHFFQQKISAYLRITQCKF